MALIECKIVGLILICSIINKSKIHNCTHSFLCQYILVNARCNTICTDILVFRSGFLHSTISCLIKSSLNYKIIQLITLRIYSSKFNYAVN